MPSPRSLALLLLLLVAAACARSTEPLARPAPTDPRARGEGDGGESLRRLERERWIEDMHRAAPGVDWRAIEERNREAARVRRNLLAAARAKARGGGAAAVASPWEEVGSSNQAGHTRCAALGPLRPEGRYLYVGSAGGGLWRKLEGGEDWQALSDSVYGGVDGVVVLRPWNLAQEDIVLMRRGAQVRRSTTAGSTWFEPWGLSELTEVRRMLVLPDAAQTVLIYGRASIGPSGGDLAAIYASRDGARTFQLLWSANNSWRGDIWAPRLGPGAGDTVYLLQNGRLRRSDDKGLSFSLVGVVATDASEGSLQGSEAGAPTLYCALRQGGAWRLHRSADAGATFTDMGEPPEYWGAVGSMVAFSTDPDRVFVGGVEGWRSSSGGATWVRVNGWGEYYGDPEHRLHADLRGLTSLPDPDLPGLVDRLYVHTDGGTYLSLDRGQTVRNESLSGLGVGQFYSTLTSSRDPDLIVGGTQDQGYQRGYRLAATGDGPSSPFQQLISGDYGHLCSADGDHDLVFCTYPGFVLVQEGELDPVLHTVAFPGGPSLWLPPVVADPLDQEDFYFLGRQLWRYERAGGAWTPNLHTAFDFGAILSALAFAPSDPARVWATTTQGGLFHSTDGGATWSASVDPGPGSHYFYGSALVVDPLDPATCVVGGPGYSGPAVRRTTDGGLSWSPLGSGLPPTLVYDLVFSPDGSGDLFAATEAGAWRYRAATDTWEDAMGIDAPQTTYWSVEAVPAADLVRFGTYGRGILDLRLGAPPTSALLLHEGFELGELEDGGWTAAPSDLVRRSDVAELYGQYGVRLRKGGQAGQEAWLERTVDTLGWNAVAVGFHSRSNGYEPGEFLFLEWWDGSAWQVAAQTQAGSWSETSVALPPAAAGQAALRLRLRTNALGQAERTDVDEFLVVGSL